MIVALGKKGAGGGEELWLVRNVEAVKDAATAVFHRAENVRNAIVTVIIQRVRCSKSGAKGERHSRLLLTVMLTKIVLKFRPSATIKQQRQLSREPPSDCIK
jgi:hypothetical protein